MKKIEQGAWISDTEYGTLHRVAGDGTMHGIFDKIVDFCGRKIEHLRVDTHEQNRIMQTPHQQKWIPKVWDHTCFRWNTPNCL